MDPEGCLRMPLPGLKVWGFRVYGIGLPAAKVRRFKKSSSVQPMYLDILS